MTNPSGTRSGQPSNDTKALLEYMVYGLQSIHASLYEIAETSGAITPAQAEIILEGTKQFSIGTLADLNERIAAVRQQIKPAEAEPQVKKSAQEINGDGLSRSV